MSGGCVCRVRRQVQLHDKVGDLGVGHEWARLDNVYHLFGNALEPRRLVSIYLSG